jgi:hypothetical protein
MFMPKRAISLTLEETNLLWLRGRARGRGNLSGAVDDLITAARMGGPGAAIAARSVAGTIDLAADDPRLERADAAIRDLFAQSLARPMRVAESTPAYEPSARRKQSRRRRG